MPLALPPVRTFRKLPRKASCCCGRFGKKETYTFPLREVPDPCLKHQPKSSKRRGSCGKMKWERSNRIDARQLVRVPIDQKQKNLFGEVAFGINKQPQKQALSLYVFFAEIPHFFQSTQHDSKTTISEFSIFHANMRTAHESPYGSL